MNTIPFAAIKIDKNEAQKRASEVMTDIQKYRNKKKKEHPVEKQRIINKLRKTLWNRIFCRKVSDEEMWNSYIDSQGIGGGLWRYWHLKDESVRGFSKHYVACKTIAEMAQLSAEDSIWITDEGYKLITSKIWYI